MTTEIWKTINIDDTELNYEVSNMGKIRNKVTKKPIKLSIIDNFVCCNLQQKIYTVHGLVAKTFIKCKNCSS